jgi:hypothetical protein
MSLRITLPDSHFHMSTATQQVVSKAWNFAHVLRDDGLSDTASVEQITFLLFLKMADEQAMPPDNRKAIVPAGYDWPSLLDKTGDDLVDHKKIRRGDRCLQATREAPPSREQRMKRKPARLPTGPNGGDRKMPTSGQVGLLFSLLEVAQRAETPRGASSAWARPGGSGTGEASSESL